MVERIFDEEGIEELDFTEFEPPPKKPPAEKEKPA
jgi:hypothetical protein